MPVFIFSLLCISFSLSLSPGYGFVDFDSPAAAQKAVSSLKATGVQAQMAKVGSLSTSSCVIRGLLSHNAVHNAFFHLFHATHSRHVASDTPASGNDCDTFGMGGKNDFSAA